MKHFALIAFMIAAVSLIGAEPEFSKEIKECLENIRTNYRGVIAEDADAKKSYQEWREHLEEVITAELSEKNRESFFTHCEQFGSLDYKGANADVMATAYGALWKSFKAHLNERITQPGAEEAIVDLYRNRARTSFAFIDYSDDPGISSSSTGNIVKFHVSISSLALQQIAFRKLGYDAALTFLDSLHRGGIPKKFLEPARKKLRDITR